MSKYIFSMATGTSYTLTGNNKTASFSPPQDTVADVYQVNGSRSATVKFHGTARTINITRARLRNDGLAVVGHSALAAKVGLALYKVENGATVGNRTGSAILTFDKWGEWEDKNIPLSLSAEAVENLGIIIGSSSVFNVYDFDVKDGLVGESVTPILDLEIETSMEVK